MKTRAPSRPTLVWFRCPKCGRCEHVTSAAVEVAHWCPKHQRRLVRFTLVADQLDKDGE